jgi:hypothetical protein
MGFRSLRLLTDGDRCRSWQMSENGAWQAEMSWKKQKKEGSLPWFEHLNELLDARSQYFEELGTTYGASRNQEYSG